MKHIVYFALGSNLGNRLSNLRHAVDHFPPHISLIASSPVYETPPWGLLDQPIYLNQVVEVETSLVPLDLLDYIKDVERNMGRVETVRYGPRLIDIDILFYDNFTIDLPSLKIPHPHIAERAFVLVPLAELIPDKYLPSAQMTIKELRDLIDTSEITQYSVTTEVL